MGAWLASLSLLGALGARPPEVLVVEPDATIQSSPATAELAAHAFSHTCAALRAADVPFVTTSDTRTAKAGLPAGGVAVFPFNRILAAGEEARIAVFLSAGGRAIFMHALPAAVAAFAGMSAPRPSRAAWPGHYQKLLLTGADLLGCPAEITVRAEWVHTVDAPAAVRRVGVFLSDAGRPQAATGIYLAPSLAYITCLLVAADPKEAGAFLRAVIGHYAPALWDFLVPASCHDLGPLEGAESLAVLLDELSARRAEGQHIVRAFRAAQEAEASLARARPLLYEGFAEAAVALSKGARRAAEEAFWMAWPSCNEEMRGVWASAKAPQTWEAAAQALAAARFNVVFPYVATAAAAYYPASVLPPAADSSGRDALAEILDACHRYGLKVHARLLGLSCMFARDETHKALAASGRLMLTSKGTQLRWVCPSSPENRRRLVAAAEELVAKYAVDGLQLDYFRYPSYEGCYCGRCRQAFEKFLGRQVQSWPDGVRTGPAAQAFRDFRRRQLTGLLGEIRSAVRRARPDVPISAAVFANWAHHRNEMGQDWVAWLQQGLLSFACPMNYTSSVELFADLTVKQRSWAGSAPLCFGIGPYADRVGDFPPVVVARQVQVARACGQGWVLFNLRQALMERDLPRLCAGITYQPARLPRCAGG